MKGILIKIVFTVLFVFLTMQCIKNDSHPILTGEFMGQPLPGDYPEIFKPGTVSTGSFERDVAMTPDGKEMYFGVAYGRYAIIIYSKLNNGVWTELEVAPFAADPNYLYLETHVSPDGNRLLFLCTRPPAGKEQKPGWFYQNIWAVDRLENGTWSEAYDLGQPINTENHEYFPSVTNDSTLYFTRSIKGSGKTNIYRAKCIDGSYLEPELLPDEINGA